MDLTAPGVQHAIATRKLGLVWLLVLPLVNTEMNAAFGHPQLFKTAGQTTAAKLLFLHSKNYFPMVL